MKPSGPTTCLCVVALSIVFSACSRQPKGPGSWATENNQRAKLSDYKGKVVVLDFYATWCEPCRAETPHLAKLQRDFGSRGLQVIGLNVGGDEDRAQVPAYSKEFGIEYPLAFPDDDLVDRYLTDNQNIPQAFVFDRDGRLIKRFIGYNEQRGQELEQIVQSTLTQQTTVGIGPK